MYDIGQFAKPGLSKLLALNAFGNGIVIV